MSLTFNRDEANQFISALTGYDDAASTIPLDFATFSDNKKLRPNAPTFRVRGTLDTLWDQLTQANEAGSGIFVTINASDGRTFHAASINAIRAFFVDDDGNDPPVTYETLVALGLAPSITVQSRNGQHSYWLTPPGEDLSDFKPLQKALALKFGTDKAVSDPGRVMRLPGFNHVKDPSNPFPVRIVQIQEVEYTIKEIVDAFGIPVPAAAKAKKSTALVKAKKVSPSALQEEERVKRARAYITKMGPAIQGSNGDQHTFKIASVLVRDFSLDDDRALELFKEWNLTCEPPWSEDDLVLKLDNARQYGNGEFGSKTVDDEAFRAAIMRGSARLGEMAVSGKPRAGEIIDGEFVEGKPVTGELIFRPQRPEWSIDQFAANRGPLVHYIPGKQDGEWLQTQPTGQMVANAADLLVYYCNTAVVSYPGFGLRYYEVSEKNIATPSTRELLTPAVRELCQSMMGGFSPTPETFTTAEQHIRALPQRGSDLPLTRWEGEGHMSLHELPSPKEGDWSAHKEFTERCSCPDTLMAWVWSCFLPEDQTGREALLLFGNGNDGKSEWCRALMLFMGPVATASEILKGENRFELANLVAKRLVYFGDFRNPRPIHSKVMREVISGAFLFMEGKGKDGQSAYFHPRCLLSTNVEPRITTSDRAEFTRIRRINVASLEKNEGDRAWPKKLLQQMPAFIFECKKVYDRMVTGGKDIPITEACRLALRGGEEALSEDFDYLAERIEITGKEDDYITSKQLSDLMEKAHYKEWIRKDAYRWLRARGAKNKTPDGKEIFVTVRGRSQRAWKGVKEIESGLFEGIGGAR